MSEKKGYEQLFVKIMKVLDDNFIKYELNKLFFDEDKEGDFNHMYEAHFWLYEFGIGFQIINSSSFLRMSTAAEHIKFENELSDQMVDNGHWIGVFFDYQLDEKPLETIREYFKEVYETDILGNENEKEKRKSIDHTKKLQLELYGDFNQVKKKLVQIYTQQKPIPKPNKLFDKQFKVIYFDYKFDSNKTINELKQEIEDLTKSKEKYFKEKAYLGCFSYALTHNTNTSVTHLLTHFFEDCCFELTNEYLSQTELMLYGEDKINEKVRFCMVQEV